MDGWMDGRGKRPADRAGWETRARGKGEGGVGDGPLPVLSGAIPRIGEGPAEEHEEEEGMLQRFGLTCKTTINPLGCLSRFKGCGYNLLLSVAAAQMLLGLKGRDVSGTFQP
jgi:hypothetical protein